MSQALEQERIFFNGFPSGYYPNRNPLGPPIDRGEDAAIDGADLLHTDRLTWIKRPGLSRWSNQAVSAPTTIQSIYTHENSAGTNVIVDRTTHVYEMTTTSATQLFSKGVSSHCFFTSTSNTIWITNPGLGYLGNATPHRKIIAPVSPAAINPSDVKVWGITAPTAAPTVTQGGSDGQRVRIGWKWVYVYKDSTDGHISSASPPTENKHALNDHYVVHVLASSEARVDKIQLYRTKDGGSTFFFHSEVSNTEQDITDTKADDDLNTALIAPINGVNAPPLQQMAQITEHNGRLFGIAYDKVVFSGDTTNGIKEESWPATNFFKFNSFPKAILSTSQGLLVFTSNKIYVIQGELPSEFSVRLLRSRLGVLSQFCVASDGDIIYILSSFGEVLRISDRVENIGLPLHKTFDLGTFNPATSFITVHRAGNDGALFLSDNAGHMFRFGFSTETWSVPWGFSAGAGGAIASAQTGASTYELLIGPSNAGAGYLWKLDSSVYNDDGTDLIPDITFGNFMLAPPEGLGHARRAFIQQLGGQAPVCYIRPEEVGFSAGFTTITDSSNEPPNLTAPTSMTTKAYNLAAHSELVPLIMRHLQVRLSWPAQNEATELYTFGLNYTTQDT